MTHFHSPIPRQLPVPGIGYPQNITIGQAIPDLPAFRAGADDQRDWPPRPLGWATWLRLHQPWLPARG